MSKIYGEAIPTPHGPSPYAAVFFSDSGELSRYEAQTQQEAEAVVREILGKLADFVRNDASGNA